MKVVLVLSMLCAVALSSPVQPVILPKVQVAPAQVTVVKQPYTIDEPEPILRNVPLPLKALTYTNPAFVPGPVLQPIPVTLTSSVVSPAAIHHAAPVVPATYAAYGTIAAPAHAVPAVYASPYIH